jgi:uncharacterized protein (DUF1501 family)
MRMTRRAFVRGGGLALLSFGLDPLFLARAALAGPRTPAARRRVLVCLFQRGAVDGLSMLVPHGDERYRTLRPRIAIPSADVVDLDGHFGLHPALADLLPLWKAGQLAIVPACGSPQTTRSHFDAQDFMESGTPGRKSTPDGWLNRCCQHDREHAATPFRSVAFGPQLPRILTGSAPALAIQDLQAFGLRGRRQPAGDRITRAFAELYGAAATGIVAASAEEAFAAVRTLEQVNPAGYEPAHGASYPQGRLGRTLLQIAQLIKADVGLEIAFADCGGWDTHVAQGASQGQLSNRLHELGAGLAALLLDLGDRADDVVVLTMSEFGRTLAENGSGGTDHGHGTTMLVLGGGVRGGRVAGHWPGLDPDQLFEARDVAVTTDFRDLFAEVLARHLGTRDLGPVFPDYDNDPTRWPGVFPA